MAFRTLEHHVLIKIGPGHYHLEGHPEIEIVRYHGSGRGNVGFKAWTILENGRPADGSSGQHPDASDFESLDRELLRFGNCHDCGKFCRRSGHARQRCPGCLTRHEDLVRGYGAGARAAERAGVLWDSACQMVDAVLEITSFHLDQPTPTSHVTPPIRSQAAQVVYAKLSGF